jgi:hypothetical protein
LPAPVYVGDAIYAQTEVLEARESRSRPTIGIVKLRTIGFKQQGTVVITFMRTVMVYRRGHAPEIPQPDTGRARPLKRQRAVGDHGPRDRAQGATSNVRGAIIGLALGYCSSTQLFSNSRQPPRSSAPAIPGEPPTRRTRVAAYRAASVFVLLLMR